MNDTDQKLINLLRHNGRRSISDLAIDLGVSRATVKARMERLEQSRQIVGYTAILKSDEDDNAIRGIMLIEVAGQQQTVWCKTWKHFPKYQPFIPPMAVGT
jgi:DNA-binding Lrp family transcriptional regulator